MIVSRRFLQETHIDRRGPESQRAELQPCKAREAFNWDLALGRRAGDSLLKAPGGGIFSSPIYKLLKGLEEGRNWYQGSGE